jgi:hypothetical protein
VPPGITCTAVRREAAGHLAICCAAIATGSAPARALGAFKQAVLVLRRFVDGTRLVQLARDNGISLPTPTSCRYLHEGLTVLPDHTPGLSTALERAAAAGHSHLNLDGTVIRTDRVVAAGPNKADLWWSGKHKHHGGNLQASVVLSGSGIDVCAPSGGWYRKLRDGPEGGMSRGHVTTPPSRDHMYLLCESAGQVRDNGGEASRSPPAGRMRARKLGSGTHRRAGETL